MTEQIRKIVEDAFERRDEITFDTKGETRDAVETALDLLDAGRAQGGREGGRRMARQSVAEEGCASVVPPQRYVRHSGRSGRRKLVG